MFVTVKFGKHRIWSETAYDRWLLLKLQSDENPNFEMNEISSNHFPVDKMSAKYLVFNNFQCASKSFKIGENIARVSNSWVPDETPSYSASHPDPSCLHFGALVVIDKIWVKYHPSPFWRGLSILFDSYTTVNLLNLVSCVSKFSSALKSLQMTSKRPQLGLRFCSVVVKYLGTSCRNKTPFHPSSWKYLTVVC